MDKGKITIRNDCPVCKSKNINKFTTTYDRHYGYFDRCYDLFKCNNCGLLFLNPMITDEELINMYDEDSYYSYQPFEKDLLAGLAGIKKYVRYLKRKAGILLLGRLQKEHPVFDNTQSNNGSGITGRRFLDIGCGSGFKLYQMKKEGWDVRGVEIGEKAATMGNRYKLNIFNGSLTEADYGPDFFDYVWANHSFEHLTNPIETIKEIYRILKPGGKACIGIPNTKSLPFLMFKKYWYYLGVPFHPYNYNVDNLSGILKENSFRVQNTRYVGDHQGLSGSIQIFLNRNENKVSSEGKFSNLFTAIIFQQCARLLNLLCIGDCIEITAQKSA